MRQNRKRTPEEKAADIAFIRSHPHLTNTELAKQLSASQSYIFHLAKDNELEYFSNTNPIRRWVKKKKEAPKEGFWTEKMMAY